MFLMGEKFGAQGGGPKKDGVWAVTAVPGPTFVHTCSILDALSAGAGWPKYAQA